MNSNETTAYLSFSIHRPDDLAIRRAAFRQICMRQATKIWIINSRCSVYPTNPMGDWSLPPGVSLQTNPRSGVLVRTNLTRCLGRLQLSFGVPRKPGFGISPVRLGRTCVVQKRCKQASVPLYSSWFRVPTVIPKQTFRDLCWTPNSEGYSGEYRICGRFVRAQATYSLAWAIYLRSIVQDMIYYHTEWIFSPVAHYIHLELLGPVRSSVP